MRMTGLVEGKLVSRREWAPGFATIGIEARIEAFAPGQFLNLGLELDGSLVRRAYSLASAPGQTPEFYLNAIDGGALSPALLRLKTGDRVLVDAKAQGFFTLDWVPPARDLWLIATGTGLAPFISMLRAGLVLERFEKVVVVHAVRKANQLAYATELATLAAAHGGRLKRVALVSRDPVAEQVLHGRVTAALETGALEAAAGESFSREQSHVMLCGNPEMIDEMMRLFAVRGLERHRTRRPGHITVERYWDEKAAAPSAAPPSH
jgi:ferredoxin--NADP+ reductase